MASNPFFSGRIPQELFNHIESFRQESGEGKTETLVKALAQYTGYKLEDNQTPPIRMELDNIYKRLEKLENFSKITIDNKSNQKVDKKSNQLEMPYDNKEYQILSTKDLVEKIGINQSTLSKWKKTKQLPNTYFNKWTEQRYEIDFDRSETKPRADYWKFKEID